MKLMARPGINVETLPHDHSVIVSTDEVVVIHCTCCGHIKDMMCFLQTMPSGYAPGGQRWCHCHDAPNGDHNAPDAGGDVQRILAEINTKLNNCHDFQGVRQLIVEIAMREQTKRRSGVV